MSIRKGSMLIAGTRDDTPIGVIQMYIGAIAPNGWLLCDGSVFDETIYPELYSVLGSNILPDMRECVPVGAGQSTRAILDSNGHAHDVYAVGEFKDDQFQGHEHGNIKAGADTYSYNRFGIVGNEDKDGRNGPSNTGSIITKEGYGTPRFGTTTHGKQVGVNFIIKAA